MTSQFECCRPTIKYHFCPIRLDKLLLGYLIKTVVKIILFSAESGFAIRN